MSIHSLRTLTQLKQECDKLGLQPVQKGKKIGKTEYIVALRNYYLGIKSIINDTRAMRLYMNYDSPMLCYRYAELKDEEKQNIWTRAGRLILADRGWEVGKICTELLKGQVNRQVLRNKGKKG